MMVYASMAKRCFGVTVSRASSVSSYGKIHTPLTFALAVITGDTKADLLHANTDLNPLVMAEVYADFP
jgi:hypothetical protein